MSPRKNIIWMLIIAVIVIILGCILFKWSSSRELDLFILQMTTR